MRFVVPLLRTLLACGVLLAPSSPAAGPQTRFRVHVLIANKPEYHPDLLDPNLVNAWGLARTLNPVPLLRPEAAWLAPAFAL